MSAHTVPTSERGTIFSVLTVDTVSQKIERVLVGSEKMNQGSDVLHVCEDGVERTMNEIGELTEQGIKVSVIGYKETRGRPLGGLTLPHIMFPKRFTGGGWTE